ncbi:50S ribosomal protein L25 [bacterium]|nr:50S ribosomal protein L25 [bacterium]
MSQVKLEAKVRKNTGKGVARKLRREGRIPSVLYGHHLEEPIILDVNSKDVEKILQTSGKTAIINLTFGDANIQDQLAMLVDYQRNVFGTSLLHVDFKQVRMDEKVVASVPIVLVGESIGVKAGGVLEQHIHEVEIESLPQNIPAHIEIDVTNLDLGHHLTAAQVVCPEGVELKSNPEETIVSVAITRAVAEEQGAASEEANAAPAAE